jgi:hypothetical protein
VMPGSEGSSSSQEMGDCGSTSSQGGEASMLQEMEEQLGLQGEGPAPSSLPSLPAGAKPPAKASGASAAAPAPQRRKRAGTARAGAVSKNLVCFWCARSLWGSEICCFLPLFNPFSNFLCLQPAQDGGTKPHVGSLCSEHRILWRCAPGDRGWLRHSRSSSSRQ